jgi:hypothetical protein
MLTLQKNQKNAVETSIENDFKSGIHFHCTGSGKSVIALEILIKYNEKYPKHNILWICEQKSILVEQFEKDTLKYKGYSEINKIFHVLNYVENKQQNWATSVNASKFWWGKPTLLIINRAFLTSSTKYKDITLPFHLIIHDECHSIINQTTQDFYQYFLNKFSSIKCIGFTATPFLKYKPYDTIITKYNMLDAINDGIILPPKIIFFSSDNKMNNEDYIKILPVFLNDLVYKKIIVWCGMIDLCYQLANLFKQYFPEYKICIDTSESKNDNSQLFDTYDTFVQLKEKAFLFCAAKHREGSDIENLDGCIFLDGVSKRNSKTFVQCIGRVLRRDKNGIKKYGLIVDCKAKSIIECCNRISNFLSSSTSTTTEDKDINKSVFPYNVKKEKLNNSINDIIVNTISVKNKNDTTVDKVVPIFEKEVTIDIIKSNFVRKVDEKDNRYIERLEKELTCLSDKKLLNVLMCAVEILKLTNYIPHVTRGSCGSSLVCYLLGISHVDPVKYNISFARFCGTYRDSLPDIDFDFSHIQRDEVFLQLEMNWPSKVARISNHVYYHEPSALREAIRRQNIHTFISKFEIHRKLSELPLSTQSKIKKEAKELENTFKGYSLHCGGIVYFPEGVPEELKLKNKLKEEKKEEKEEEKIILGKNICSQIICNKHDIANSKQFKIDILSSRALTQLLEIYKLLKKEINPNHLFDDIRLDKKTFTMLSNGHNIGITLGESPLIRQAFLTIKPKSIEDIAICLAIIRPAAKSSRVSLDTTVIGEKKKNTKDMLKIIYDDDVIQYLKDILKCSEDEADFIRRKLSKGDKKTFLEIKEKIKDKSQLQVLNDIRKYSFCKSHSFSYAQLVYQLAYMKANHPVEFWKATLKHNESSYKKWVHIFEAASVGVQKINKNNSIYAENRNKKLNNTVLNQYDQLRQFGTFIPSINPYTKKVNFFNDSFYLSFTSASNKVEDKNKNEQDVEFNGIFASQRKLSKNKYLFFVCVGSNKYFDLIVENNKVPFYAKYIGCKGKGKLINLNLKIVKCNDIQYF